jgi:hypothetical protein
MVEILEDVGAFVLTELLAPVVAVVLTSMYLSARGAGGQIAEHDRLVANLNEDLRRWVHDRDRVAQARMSEIRQQANAMGVIRGGALAEAAGKVYRRVLHEYRDEATRKIRQRDELTSSEGRAHAWRRERRRTPMPELRLPPDCEKLLATWRAKADEDPSRPELEPCLRAL